MRLFEFEIPKQKPNSMNSVDEQNGEKIVEFIKNHCSEYLGIAVKAKAVLYRGIDIATPGPVFVGNPRTNRQPSGLTNELHEKFIKCFKLTGLSATRNKTISCISSINAAVGFAFGNRTNIYVIFPINGFKYTWSTKYPDIGDLAQSEDYSIIQKFDNFDINKITPEIAAKFVKYFGFTDQNLIKALKVKHEVAVAGQYVAIQLHVFNSYYETALGFDF